MVLRSKDMLEVSGLAISSEIKGGRSIAKFEVVVNKFESQDFFTLYFSFKFPLLSHKPLFNNHYYSINSLSNITTEAASREVRAALCTAAF
jgi:hypothetical protein